MSAAACVGGSYPVGTSAPLYVYRAHAGVGMGQAKRLPIVHAGSSAGEITAPVPTAAKTSAIAKRNVPLVANPALFVAITQYVANYAGSHAHHAQKNVPGAANTAGAVACPVLFLATSTHARRDVISS